MRASVILIAFHSDSWIESCINSLATSARTQYHLVIIDNGGNSLLDSIDYSAFDYERLCTPRTMGFAEANNYALTHASRLEKHVIFLNQDTVSASDWITGCIDVLHNSPRLGAVSPLIRSYDGSEWDPSFLSCITPDQHLILDSEIPVDDFSVLLTHHIPAPAYVISSRLLRRIGPFDPVFGSYYEDYDLCLRIRRAGYQVGFCRAAVINHFSGSTTDTRKKELKRMRLIIRNQLLFRVRKKERDVGRWRVLTHHIFIQFPRTLVRGLLGRKASQPPNVVLGALLDLIKIGTRLLSKKVDLRKWHDYLESIDWDDQFQSFNHSSR